MFLQDYHKWALEKGRIKWGQNDIDCVCKTVADPRLPVAYLNQMDHQHKVCKKGQFILWMPPPPILLLNGIVTVFITLQCMLPTVEIYILRAGWLHSLDSLVFLISAFH